MMETMLMEMVVTISVKMRYVEMVNWTYENNVTMEIQQTMIPVTINVHSIFV
jgi:hypothetical protein